MTGDPIAGWNAWAEIAGAALWRASWQGGAAIAAVWLIARAFPQIPPRVRCWLWRLAYLKLLAALLWTGSVSLPLLPPRSTPPGAAGAREGGRQQRRGDRSDGATGRKDMFRFLAPSPRRSGRPVAAAFRLLPTGQTAPSRAGWVLLFWLSAVGGCAARQRAEWRASRRLRGSASPESDIAVLELYAALCERFAVSRPPGLMRSEEVDGPVLVGLLHPVILLPSSALDAESHSLRAILSHELAHLQRNDLLWAWLPALAKALFPFHPLVWLTQREWALAHEIACDETAMQIASIPAPAYGQAVLQVAARRGRRFVCQPLAVPAAGPYHSLRRRLIAIQQMQPISRRRLLASGALVGVVGATALVPWQVTTRAAPALRPRPRLRAGATPIATVPAPLATWTPPSMPHRMFVFRARWLGPHWQPPRLLLTIRPRRHALVQHRHLRRRSLPRGVGPPRSAPEPPEAGATPAPPAPGDSPVSPRPAAPPSPPATGGRGTHRHVVVIVEQEVAIVTPAPEAREGAPPAFLNPGHEAGANQPSWLPSPPTRQEDQKASIMRFSAEREPRRLSAGSGGTRSGTHEIVGHGMRLRIFRRAEMAPLAAWIDQERALGAQMFYARDDGGDGSTNHDDS